MENGNNPNLRLSNVALDFGTMAIRSKSLTFDIENFGATVEDFDIKFDRKPKWASFEYSDNGEFPLTVTVKVDPSSCSGGEYNANILIYANGEVCASVTIFVTVKKKAVQSRQGYRDSQPVFQSATTPLQPITIGFLVFIIVMVILLISAAGSSYNSATPDTYNYQAPVNADAILSEALNSLIADNTSVFCVNSACPPYDYGKLTLHNNSSYALEIYDSSGCSFDNSAEFLTSGYLGANSSLTMYCPLVYSASEGSYRIDFTVMYPPNTADHSEINVSLVLATD